MEEAQDGITIAPLNLPVRQDLVVDLPPKIEQIASLKPGADCKLPTKEEIDAIKPLRDCIECLACVSVCPVMDVTKFLGPTAMRQEMRLALDPRDTGDWVPDVIRDGLFNCTSCQACYKVCPKKIKSREKRSRNSGRSQTSGGSPCPGTGRSRRSSKRPAGVLSGSAPSFMEQVGTTIEPNRAVGNRGILCRLHVQPAPAAVGARRDRSAQAKRHPGDHPPGPDLLRFAVDPDRPVDYVDTLRKRNIDAFRTGASTP